ncbi:MAG: hypothetical protein IPO58_24200 [Betaproteobacteria bacterium]|nr:hypothetical protein [Betaproteobacteria bacterium]
MLESGKAMGWGGNGSGRLPADIPELCSVAAAPTQPVEVSMQQKLRSIAAGHGISLGLTERNEVAIWGLRRRRWWPARVGAAAMPQRVAALPLAMEVTAGEFHFAAIDEPVSSTHGA